MCLNAYADKGEVFMAEERNGHFITKEDKIKLEAELSELKLVKVPQVTKDIAEARAHGDLSENAEYDEAKNEEARVHGRIAELEAFLASATIMEDTDAADDVVSVGCTVTVYDTEYDEIDDYVIVGFTGADPANLKISSESPIGAALMGKHVGETVDANTPGGIIKLEIRAIKH